LRESEWLEDKGRDLDQECFFNLQETQAMAMFEQFMIRAILKILIILPIKFKYKLVSIV
jgi:hypothetical protein